MGAMKNARKKLKATSLALCSGFGLIRDLGSNLCEESKDFTITAVAAERLS